jgi:hypothetical protein
LRRRSNPEQINPSLPTAKIQLTSPN